MEGPSRLASLPNYNELFPRVSADSSFLGADGGPSSASLHVVRAARSGNGTDSVGRSGLPKRRGLCFHERFTVSSSMACSPPQSVGNIDGTTEILEIAPGARVIEIVRQRSIHASVDQVWSLIEPVDRLPEWFSGIETAELLAGRGLGRRQRVRGRWDSQRFEIDQTVVEYEPNHVLAWCNDTEMLNGKPAPRVSKRTESRIRLRPAGAATTVELISRLEPGNVLAGAALRLIAVSRIGHLMESSLDRVERILRNG
jgi:uncharacterized protein YndB with AHSA1/START domain